MKQLFTVVFMILFSCAYVFPQDSIVDQDVKVNSQVWIDYNFPSFINENKNISTQIGYRKISPQIYNRYLAVSTLNIDNKKKLLNLNTKKPLIKTYHLGAGLIYTANISNKDNFELRTFQGFKFHIPTLKLITLHNYFRFEQRFQNQFDGSGFTSAFRIRNRISTAISWNKHYLSFTEGLYFPIEAELFFNLKKADRFNDLIRISPGIGYKLPSKWRFEMYLIFNRTKNITETNNKSSDFILRFRIYKGGIKDKDDNKIVPLNNDPGQN